MPAEHAPSQPAATPSQPAAPAQRAVYVGAYTDGDNAGQGINFGTLETASGRVTLAGTVPVANPSFLAIAPSGRVLYAVNEQEKGQVSALSLAGAEPKLINSQSSRGAGPTHLCVHPSGRYVLSANYDSGSVVVHPVRADGGLEPASDLAVHTGSGPNSDRQSSPHAHQILPDPAGSYLHSVDLGTDTVYAYQLDLATGKLSLRHQAKMRSGSGPRHLAFHPNGRFGYLATELGGTVITCGYADGVLTPLHEQPSVPGARGNQPAEVVVSPAARHLYVSNRGPDSVSVFSIGADGQLTAGGDVPCGGKTPRFIGLDPSGRYLFSASQDSNTITTFTVAVASGAITRLPGQLSTPQPTCVLAR
jgi:6-phosphogluconolactonase